MSGAVSKFLRHDAVLLVLRLFVGGLFLVACVDKIVNPHDFAIAIKNYDFLPEPLINIWAITLPWVELAAGLCLVAGFWTRSAAAVAELLFVSFVIALGQALFRGLDISCGCFETGGQATINSLYLVRDVSLIAVTAPLLLFGGGRWSLEEREIP